jgi:hypothetical protein
MAELKERRCHGNLGICKATTSDWQADGWSRDDGPEKFFCVYCPTHTAERIRYQADVDEQKRRALPSNLLLDIEIIENQENFFASVENNFGPDPFLSGESIRRRWITDPVSVSTPLPGDLSLARGPGSCKVENIFDRRRRYLDEIMKIQTKATCALSRDAREADATELAIWADWFTSIYGSDPFGTGQSVRQRWAADTPLLAKHLQTRRRVQYQAEAEKTRPRQPYPKPKLSFNDPGYDDYCRHLADKLAKLYQEAWFRAMEEIYGLDPFCSEKPGPRTPPPLRLPGPPQLGEPMPLRHRWATDYCCYHNVIHKRNCYEYVAEHLKRC